MFVRTLLASAASATLPGVFLLFLHFFTCNQVQQLLAINYTKTQSRFLFSYNSNSEKCICTKMQLLEWSLPIECSNELNEPNSIVTVFWSQLYSLEKDKSKNSEKIKSVKMNMTTIIVIDFGSQSPLP